MPNKQYVQLMSRYNKWQNDNLISAADTLSDGERAKDRGAFFGSIDRTFSHLLWGDRMWMSRFAGTPTPEGGISQSSTAFEDWDIFKQERKAFDQRIIQWGNEVEADWFTGDLSWYSGAIDKELTKPVSELVMHLFNHQTHHRGQIHVMLTIAGAKPGDTDIPFLPESYTKS